MAHVWAHGYLLGNASSKTLATSYPRHHHVPKTRNQVFDMVAIVVLHGAALVVLRLVVVQRLVVIRQLPALLPLRVGPACSRYCVARSCTCRTCRLHTVPAEHFGLLSTQNSDLSGEGFPA